MAETNKTLLSSRIIVILALVVAIASIGFATYQYSEAQKLKTTEGAKQVAEDEAKALKEKVAKLMQLPDEKPTVATIKDITKLKDQPFFNGAKNGDKVLIFTEARKAVIYREGENIVINSGPIAVTSDNETSKGVTVMASASGSSKDAATKVAAISGVTVGEAKAKKNYSKTQVLDVSGNSSEKAQEIATALGGEVITTLPSGETAPAGASIVVFVKR